MAVSLRPSTFAQGGGLIDDADVEITRARFGMGYGGNGGGQGDEAVTLQLTLKDNDGAEHQQYYSAGKGFVPSEDPKDPERSGLELVPVGDKTAPSGSSNMALFIGALINAGYPEDLLDSGDISALEGTKGHVNRIPEPKRGGAFVRQGKNADQPKTVLVFTTVTDFPGNTVKGKATSAKSTTTGKGGTQAGATKGAAKPEANEELVEELKGHLLTVLGESATGSLKKVALVPALFKAIDKGDANRKELLGLAGKDEVLGNLGEMFEYDGKELKMA